MHDSIFLVKRSYVIALPSTVVKCIVTSISLKIFVTNGKC